MIALALAMLLTTSGGGSAGPLASFPGFSLQHVQYYTPPPPYSYRKYYAYKNNTAPTPARAPAKKPARPKR